MTAPRVLDGDVLQVSPMGIGAAIFSADDRRRRWLYRLIRPAGKRIGFVMLNPSDAGANDDDPTITRCIGFAAREGGGSMEVANVFDVIMTDSKLLAEALGRGAGRAAADPNSRHYLDHVLSCDLVIVAWGAHPLASAVTLDVRGPLFCLGKTKDGHPRHPLYLRKDAKLEPWQAVRP